MAEVEDILYVNEIAHDDQKLREKVAHEIGFDVVLDDNETIGEDFGTVDKSVCAILVKKHAASGAVRVFKKEFLNVMTGPGEGNAIIIILRKLGEDCRIYGRPTMRYFYKRGK